MKKLFCFVISIILILSSAFVVGAQTAQSFFSLSNAECNYQKTATLNLNVNGGVSFAAAVIDLSYDASALRLTNVTSSLFEADFSTDSSGATITLFDLDNTSSVSGVIASLTFVSLNKSGEFEVAMSAMEGNICDAYGNVLDVGFTNGKITVLCDHYYVYERTVEPTCSKKGEIIYICRRCNCQEITYIDTIAHTPVDWVTTLEPDCVNKGIKTRLCSVCDTVLETQEIAALGHVFGEELVDVKPTCTKDGVSYKLCKICDHEEYGVIAASEHGNASWKTTSPAGCEEGGIASLVCNDCGDVLEIKTIDATGHLFGWAVVTKPTCDKVGSEAYLCLVCGYTKQTRTIEKLAHTPGEELVTVEPTCDKAGEKQVCCTVCDEVLSTSAVEKIEHTYNRMTVITAPDTTNSGIGKYYCKACGEEIETVTLEATNASITAEDVGCFVSDTIKIPVVAQNNPGFSVGVLRIKYSTKDLIYKGVEAAAVTDITVGVAAAGELTVVMCPDTDNVTANGEWFSLMFEVVDGATDSEVEITYKPNDDFSDEDGNQVFFNITGAKVSVYQYTLGDINYDRSINAADLALMKKIIASLVDIKYDPAADVVIDGMVNAADLAQMKKYLAGFINSFK